MGDDRLAYGNSDFGVLPYSNGEAHRLPMKSTWSQVSSIHCPDKVSHDAQIRQQQLLRPEKIVAETNRPHCFLDISMKKSRASTRNYQSKTRQSPANGRKFYSVVYWKAWVWIQRI